MSRMGFCDRGGQVKGGANTFCSGCRREEPAFFCDRGFREHLSQGFTERGQLGPGKIECMRDLNLVHRSVLLFKQCENGCLQ